jgi:hypothetical protein
LSTEETVTVVVLNDGETFTDIDGCTVQVIPAAQYEEVTSQGGDARDFAPISVDAVNVNPRLLSNRQREQLLVLLEHTAAALRNARNTTENSLSESAHARINPLVAEFSAGQDLDLLDMQDVLTDLLTDIRHWSSIERIDFDVSLKRSKDHFNAENTGGEE